MPVGLLLRSEGVTMPRTREPEDDDGARVWSQATIKVNLGDYESVELSIGTSRPVRDHSSSIRNAHKALHRDHMKLLSERVEEIRELWSNK